MALEQELKDLISKNLPQHVSEVLQERLKKADNDADRVVHLENKVDQHAKRIVELTECLGNTQRELESHEKLTDREQAMAVRERDIEIEILKIKLGAAEDNAKFAKDVALGLVRNTEYRRQVFHTSDTAGHESTNGMPGISKNHRTTISTNETEQTA